MSAIAPPPPPAYPSQPYPGQPYPYYPPAPQMPPAMLDAAASTFKKGAENLGSAVTYNLSANAVTGAQHVINGADILRIALPQASPMVDRFVANAQLTITSIEAGRNWANTARMAKADAEAGEALIRSLKPAAQ